MKAKEFVHRFTNVLMNDQGDNSFSTMRMITGGGTSARIAKTLNFATCLLDPGEIYLEVGVFRGFTLLSAAYLNNKPCYGIDNFDVKVVHPAFTAEQVKGELARNMAMFANGNAHVIENDFRAVTEVPGKIGVLFVDGKHTSLDVLDNLRWAEPFLADDAIILFDDVTLNEVDLAIKGWWFDHRQNYDLVFHARPVFVGSYDFPIFDHFLHNGLSILWYSRKGFNETA